MKLPLIPPKHPDLTLIDRNSYNHERELHSFFEVTVSQVKSSRSMNSSQICAPKTRRERKTTERCNTVFRVS